MQRIRPYLKYIGIAVAAVLVLFMAIILIPVGDIEQTQAETQASRSYEQAVDQFDKIKSNEQTTLSVLEKCESRLFSQGEKVDRTVVLFHGLTNCPEQFVDFGRELYSRGANVVILRAPYHGFVDQESGKIGSVDEVGELEAGDIIRHVNESIDIAQGLGEQVEVIGLSMGGVQALVAAAYRDDVDKVTAIAPAVSIPGAPQIATTALINAGNRLPNLSLPSGGADIDHTYKGESTGALSALFWVARETLAQIEADGVKADLTVVLNPADTQVDNTFVESKLRNVKDASGTTTFSSLPDIGLPHDVIDKDQPLQNVEVVYPLLYSVAGFDS